MFQPGWSAVAYDVARAQLGGSLVSLASQIGPEAIAALWNAVLLKKRYIYINTYNGITWICCIVVCD